MNQVYQHSITTGYLFPPSTVKSSVMSVKLLTLSQSIISFHSSLMFGHQAVLNSLPLLLLEIEKLSKAEADYSYDQVIIESSLIMFMPMTGQFSIILISTSTSGNAFL